MTLTEKLFENVVGKGENGGKHISFFAHNIFSIFHSCLICHHTFNIDSSKFGISVRS